MEEQQKTNAVNKTQNSAATQTVNLGANETETNKKEELSVKQAGGEILGQVKEKASGVLDEQKNVLTSGLTSVADSIRKVGDNLRESEDENNIGKMTAQYGNQLARKIEGFSDYIENADLKILARDVERFARKQPALFIGGAFALGLLAARFLKSSNPSQGNYQRRKNTGNHRSDKNLTGGEAASQIV